VLAFPLGLVGRIRSIQLRAVLRTHRSANRAVEFAHRCGCNAPMQLG